MIFRGILLKAGGPPDRDGTIWTADVLKQIAAESAGRFQFDEEHQALMAEIDSDNLKKVS